MFGTFQTKEYLSRMKGTPRPLYLQNLVNEFQDSTKDDKRRRILANLANMAYDPINYEYFGKLRVVDLLIDVLLGDDIDFNGSKCNDDDCNENSDNEDEYDVEKNTKSDTNNKKMQLTPSTSILSKSTMENTKKSENFPKISHHDNVVSLTRIEFIRFAMGALCNCSLDPILQKQICVENEDGLQCIIHYLLKSRDELTIGSCMTCLIYLSSQYKCQIVEMGGNKMIERLQQLFKDRCVPHLNNLAGIALSIFVSGEEENTKDIQE